MNSTLSLTALARKASALTVAVSLFLAAIPAVATAASGNTFRLLPLSFGSQQVGTPFNWLAVPKRLVSSKWRYQYSIATNESGPTIVRGFSSNAFFTWTPIEEGHYEILLEAKQIDTGETQQVTASFQALSRITDARAVVSPTTHPLVVLYSTPPCTPPEEVRVQYRAPGAEQPLQHTPWTPCQSDKSINFLVAGLLGATTYELRHETRSESTSQESPLLTWTTEEPRETFPQFSVLGNVYGEFSTSEGILLHGLFGALSRSLMPVATDLSGRVVWYYRWRALENLGYPWQIGNYILRLLPGGNMLLQLNYRGGYGQLLREIDLAGNPVRETNVEEINRQLVARGEDEIGWLSHDAIRLPNGHTLVLGSVERVLNDVQGPEPVNIVGDMVIDLDANLQVTWTWNTFDHLDVTRRAVLDEKCTPVTAGCPPLSKAREANDWTHANTIDYGPADGSLLLSLRNQDWVVKIDYSDGSGNGDVLWRLGRGGDFPDPPGADPWFSHQHDARFEGDQLVVFDNGNTRCADAGTSPCNSRGQAYVIDEAERAVSLVVNADLGAYSPAYGSAQRLSNGNYHFTAGIALPDLAAISTEVKPDGTSVFAVANSDPKYIVEYRSYRLPDLYSPDFYMRAAAQP